MNRVTIISFRFTYLLYKYIFRYFSHFFVWWFVCCLFYFLIFTRTSMPLHCVHSVPPSAYRSPATILLNLLKIRNASLYSLQTQPHINHTQMKHCSFMNVHAMSATLQSEFYAASLHDILKYLPHFMLCQFLWVWRIWSEKCVSAKMPQGVAAVADDAAMSQKLFVFG